jgi:hypothetical protein
MNVIMGGIWIDDRIYLPLWNIVCLFLDYTVSHTYTQTNSSDRGKILTAVAW